MTALAHFPAPGAASALRRVTGHARTEAMLLVRNGEQLLLALVIPIAILIAVRVAGARLDLDLATTAASVLGLAVWSSGFTSLAVSTGFERRYGVLERLASTPLTRTGLIAGKALAILLITAGQLLILTLVALGLGWRPVFSVPALAVSVLATAVGLVAYAAWGLTLAGTLRAELTLALANLIYLVMLAAGAVLVPVASYPAAVQPVVALLPTAALGETLRTAAAGGVLLSPMLILAAWALLGVVVARKVFRWMS